jgi:hypothetical protein
VGENIESRIENIPESLHKYIALAQEWGIGDDYEREEKVNSATDSEILELCTVSELLDQNNDFYAWLYEDLDSEKTMQSGYILFTNLTLAMDLAILQKTERGL